MTEKSNEERELKVGEKRYFKRLINNFTERSEKLISDIERIKSEISDSDETGIYYELKNILSDAQMKQVELNGLYQSIYEIQDDQNESLAEGIESFISEYEDKVNKLEQLQSKVDGYERDLFGYVDEAGIKIGGIKDRIKSQVNKLDELHSENKLKHDKLYDEIEGLLKGASTVALSKAFKEHKDSFNMINYIWLSVFIVSIFSMMGMSLWAFSSANYQPAEMWKYTLGNLPFLAGAVWLAIYSSKQRSQNKRLQQEYAFKEDVSKIYYGLKKEIEDLGETDLGLKLNEKVIEILVSVVSLNPSSTLDSKTHDDKGPILEAIKNLKTILPSKTDL